MNLKDKKLPFIAGGAAIIIILLLLIFMPSRKAEEGPEVISKRVKIELPADSAAIDSSTDAAASAESLVAQTGVQGMPPGAHAPAPSPVPAPVMQPAPVQNKPIEVKPAPVQIVPKRIEEPVKAAQAPVERKKEEARKAVKAAKEETPQPVKAEKKKVAAEKTKKVAEVSKRLLGDNAWVINLASFPSLSEAQNLATKLKKAGHKAYVVKFTKESVQWHRVRVGFYPSRDAALKTGKSIKVKFNLDEPWVTKPDKAEFAAHM